MESIHDNPILIEKEVRPVCDLFKYTSDADATAKAAVCDQAAQVFLR